MFSSFFRHFPLKESKINQINFIFRLNLVKSTQKMKIYLLVFTITVLKAQLESFKTTDYCIVSEKKCKSSYDDAIQKYKMICDKLDCEGDLSYQCGSDHCTINKETCEDFLKLKTFKKSLPNVDLGNKYQMFIRVIRKCTKNSSYLNVTNAWQADEVCINGEGCFFRKIIPMRSHTNIKVLKRVKCPCMGYYSHQCGKDYCAVDGNACSGFSLNNVKNSKIQAFLMGVKHCGNDRMTF